MIWERNSLIISRHVFKVSKKLYSCTWNIQKFPTCRLLASFIFILTRGKMRQWDEKGRSLGKIRQNGRISGVLEYRLVRPGRILFREREVAGFFSRWYLTENYTYIWRPSPTKLTTYTGERSKPGIFLNNRVENSNFPRVNQTIWMKRILLELHEQASEASLEKNVRPARTKCSSGLSLLRTPALHVLPQLLYWCLKGAHLSHLWTGFTCA